MATFDHRVREIRQRLGFKQGEFATALGVTQGTVSKWETGQILPDLSMRMKIAELGGYQDPIRVALNYDEEHEFRTSDWTRQVDVVGAVEQGALVEQVEWEEDQQFRVVIPTLPGWERFSLKGYVLRDASADLKYPVGSVVFAARCQLEILDPRAGDIIVFASSRENSLYEVTLRKVFTSSSQQKYLMNVNGSCRYIDPMPYESRLDVLAAGGYPQLGVLGIVVSSFVIADSPRFSGDRSATPADSD